MNKILLHRFQHLLRDWTSFFVLFSLLQILTPLHNPNTVETLTRLYSRFLSHEIPGERGPHPHRRVCVISHGTHHSALPESRRLHTERH